MTLPNNVKKLKGTLRPCRVNDNEPKPATDNMKPPFRLSKIAKKHWKVTLNQLLEAKVATNLDTTALAVYCEQYALWFESMERVESEGAVIDTNRGPQKNPHFVVADTALRNMQKFLAEFGMMPASRAKVNMTDKKDTPTNPFAKIKK